MDPKVDPKGWISRDGSQGGSQGVDHKRWIPKEGSQRVGPKGWIPGVQSTPNAIASDGCHLSEVRQSQESSRAPAAWPGMVWDSPGELSL